MPWRNPSRPERRGWPSRIGRAAAACAILLLAFIGFLHLTRGSAVRHVIGVGLGGNPVPVTHAAFLSNVAMLTGAAVSDGHRVELALNGDGTCERMLADLAGASSSIMLQVYYGNSGRLAERLGRLLIDRARAGVAVLMLYDAFGTSALSDDYLQRFMALSIAGATRTLYITTAYFAPDRAFVELLSRSAARGVDVRILTAGPATDMHLVRLAGRAWYQTLLDGGVRLNEVFADDLRHSREITRDAFRERAWWHRVAESTAWMFTRLL